MKERVVIFDFDGVFASNCTFHREHMEKFSKKEISEEEFYNLHSGNVYENDGKGLEMEHFDAIGYCNFIEEDLKNLPMVSGMNKVIAHAKEIGKLYVVSSGCAFNIRNFFTKNELPVDDFGIYGVETDPSKKVKFEKIILETSINPENMIFVTDTLGDMIEASEKGIASIGVSWGFQRVETLEKGAPFGFAYKASDIIELIDTFFADGK